MDASTREVVLPLFPLPSLVFFPETRVPLHIFEPRYREMVADALAGDSLIGMALLRPGGERAFLSSPPVYDVGTIGEIEQAVEYDDGRYDIILNGISRYQIVEHIDHSPYRLARVRPTPEESGEWEAVERRKGNLRELSRQYLSHFRDSEVPELESASLSSIVNALAMALNIEASEKQALLEESNLMRRSVTVTDLIRDRLRILEFLAPYRREGSAGMN